MYDNIFFDLGDTLVDGADSTQWLPGAKETLVKCSAAGLRLGILSNTGSFNRHKIRERLPADFPWVLFTDRLIVVSGEHPWAKPQLEIFGFAIAQTGASGFRSLYCSESLPETVAAQQAGMHLRPIVWK